MIPAQQQKERLAVCNSCAQNRKGRCVQCGCKVADRVQHEDKIRRVGGRDILIKAACPLKRWGEYFGV